MSDQADDKNVHEIAKKALSRLRTKLRGVRIVTAPRDRAEDLERRMQRVLDAIGEVLDIDSHSIFVTDQSQISDFTPDDKELDQIRAQLRVGIGVHDFLVDIAERLEEEGE